MSTQYKEHSAQIKSAVIAGVFALIAACIGGVFLILNTLVSNGFIVIGPSVQAGNPNGQVTPTSSISSCTVPSLVGKSQSEAEGLLTANGLYAIKTFEYNGNILQGLVISQDPLEGAQLTPCQGGVGILISLGLTPTPAPTSIVTDPIVGEWNWFNETEVSIYSDGTAINATNGLKARWQLINASERKYIITWGNGTYVDVLVLSVDGQRLEGTNQLGDKVYATKQKI